MKFGDGISSKRQTGMLFLYGAALSIAGSLCLSIKLAGYVMLALAGFAFLLSVQCACKAAREDKRKAASMPRPEEN